MSFLRKAGNGEYYINYKGLCQKKVVRNWWLIKQDDGKRTGHLVLGVVSIPRELVGKKIQFKVEVLS